MAGRQGEHPGIDPRAIQPSEYGPLLVNSPQDPTVALMQEFVNLEASIQEMNRRRDRIQETAAREVKDISEIIDTDVQKLRAVRQELLDRLGAYDGEAAACDMPDPSPRATVEQLLHNTQGRTRF